MDIFHITIGGNGNQRIYFDDTDRIYYLNCMAEAVNQYGIKWLCFAVMGNHSHLLFKCDRDEIRSVLFKADYKYARMIRRKYNLTGEIFKVRPTVTKKQHETDIQYAVRYIHKNRKEDLGESIFTSYPIYLESFIDEARETDYINKNGMNQYLKNFDLDPIREMIDTAEILKYFGSNRKTAVRQFIHFHYEKYFNHLPLLDDYIKEEFNKNPIFRSREYDEANRTKFLRYLNTKEDSREIRNSLIAKAIHSTTYSNVKIGEIFNVSRETVRNIRNR